MSNLNRYWVSWWSGYYESEGCKKPPFQVWISGSRDRADGKDEVSLCAVIDAASPNQIEKAIKRYFPDCQMRFCDLQGPDFQPQEGRFPGFEGRTRLTEGGTQ